MKTVEVRKGHSENWGLSTGRLHLRRLRPGDGAVLFAYRSEPRVRRFQSMCPGSVEEAELFVTQQQQTAFDTPETWCQVGIDLQEENKLIGDLGLYFRDEASRQVEMGFTISPAFQRRGFAREAMMAMLGYLFEDVGKHRVILKMDAENVAAIALATSLGFRKEAHFVKSYWDRDHWADEVVCAMLRSEWGA